MTVQIHETPFTETVTMRRRIRFQLFKYFHARFASNECILYKCANGNAVPLLDQHMRRTIYMPLIVETEGNWEKGDEKVMQTIRDC